MTADPRALEDLAVEIATATGELLLAGLARDRTRVDTKSSGTDMVTEMDRAAEAHVAEALAAARPDDGLIGEEGTQRPSHSGVRWIVDPLDGTTNYLYRIAGFGISLAAEVDGRVVAGAVADPMRAAVYSAARGHGARRDGQPLRCSSQRELGRALVGTGFAYDAERRRRQAALLVGVIGEIRDIRRLGAAALDLCAVAEGTLDAFYEAGLAPWDHAAGGLIAAEAGAVVGTLAGATTGTATLVAAPPPLFVPLCALLRRSGVAGV